MHILESPTGQKPWFQQYVCTGYGNQNKGCHAVLLVSGFDLRLTTGGHFENGPEKLYLTFNCPVCGVPTDIPRNDVPDRVYDLIKERYHNGMKTHRGRR